jgi:hypothetical protein
VPIPLDDLSCALGSFLGSFCKTVKTHHNRLPFLEGGHLAEKKLDDAPIVGLLQIHYIIQAI